MNDILETIGILFALGSVATIVSAFLLFMRAIGRKERDAIERYHRGDYYE